MDTKDLIIQKMQELIDHYWHYHDCSKCHEIKIEIARLRSRLEPDIELDSDVKVYNERQDLQARTRIPVEPDKKSA